MSPAPPCIRRIPKRWKASFGGLCFAVILGVWALAIFSTDRAYADAEEAWRALQQGGVVALVRHARAPGTGDPVGFRLDACETQRNLSPQGREEARQMGMALRARNVAVEVVMHSRWCRARDTATLAFPDLAKPAPFLDSFFSERTEEPAKTAELRGFIVEWRGRSGVALLVTHQVNITALTGIVPRESEVLVLRPTGEGHQLIGRIAF
jgi:phosphohistidine phosphatase SixA